jgi:hypothetical protein
MTNPYINTLRTPLYHTTHPPSNNTNQWRCPHHRLHLDGQDCIPISPDSPIIDTPSKYRKMQARRNAAALPTTNSNSQATNTQPTPSGPPARLQRMTSEERIRASATFSLNKNGEPLFQEQEQEQNVDQDDSQDFVIPSSPPSQHQALERVPETPMADLPSSPPLPLLTAANLRQLNSQPGHEVASGASSSSYSHPAASPAPPPSVYSLPSEVAHRISRLILRTRINAANHAASEMQLQAFRGALEMALARVQYEASRVDTWMATAVALLLLCLAYAAWCRYKSAEFEFIEGCRREWFEL